MSLSRTPSQKPATKVTSFASCFGATVPVSPRREGGQASLAGHAGINYRRLRLDDFENEDHCCYGARGTEYQEQAYSEKLYNQHSRQVRAITMKLGKHAVSKERPAMSSETVYVSEGEQEMARVGSTGVLKWGKQRVRREKSESRGRYSASETSKKEIMCESEGEIYKHGRQRKHAIEGATRKKEEMEVDAKTGELMSKTGRSKREKAVKEEAFTEVGDSPRRASFGSKMREACAQVLETARRGSPHLSELFVGNQLLMRVTASSFTSRNAKSMAPSYGFHVFTADPASISVMVSSPAHSSSSAF